MKKLSNFTTTINCYKQNLGIGNEQVNKNLLILLSLFLLSTLIVMLFSIFVLQNVLTASYLTQKVKQDRFYFWIEKVEEYPNAPDVLYNAAVAADEINKKETAIKLLNASIGFDPLFTNAINLRDEIVAEAR